MSSSFDRERAHLLLQVSEFAFYETKSFYENILKGETLSSSLPHYQERLEALRHYQKTGFYYSDY
jgi:hypothetical protein